jgi:hypothetical protein
MARNERATSQSQLPSQKPIVLVQNIERPWRLQFGTSMQDLVLDGEVFGVPLSRLIENCRLFQEDRSLLAQPRYDVRSRVSIDSFRTFVDAIGGTEPNITDGNASDLELLSDEFKFTGLSTAVATRKPSSESSTSPSSSAPVKVSPPKQTKQFPPSVKKGESGLNVPDGIIAYLTRKCGGNVHDRNVVDITCGSFEKETRGANPHSGAFNNEPVCAAKNAADLETGSFFFSAYRKNANIPHTRNNWICYDLKKRRIVPTHYTIRAHGGDNLKSWVVETSTDGENWREVARVEDNRIPADCRFTATFPVAGGEECRFIRLVNIGMNHFGDDRIWIGAWEIFGTLIE